MKNEFSHTVLLLGGNLDGPERNMHPRDELFRDLAKDESDIRIEEAAIALARGTFTRGWRLAMQQDSVLTPLVIEIALEYWESLPGEEMGREGRRFIAEPLVIFGNDFEEEEREILGYPAQIGCIKLIPEFDLSELYINRVVLIGGSRDVAKLIDLVKSQAEGAPIYSIPSTGGAALDLGHLNEALDLERMMVSRIVSLESEMHFDPSQVELSDESVKRGLPPIEFEQGLVPQFRFALYPLLVNAILDSDAGMTHPPVNTPIPLAR
jgi:hypothetical protein